MKILVIGHTVVDKIHFKNNVKTKPGGIYFSLLGFLYSGLNIEIDLLTTVTKNNFELFSDAFSKVNPIGNLFSDKMPVNRLVLKENEEREETYEYIPSGLDVNQISDFSIYDGVFINMVSGFDIEINDLYYIRQNFQGNIYIDIHTLSRGVDKNKHRYFRPIPHAEVWHGNVDFLQANESEILTLGENFTKDEIIDNILSLGTKGVIVTKGEKGAEINFVDSGKSTLTVENKSIASSEPCVGCGDFFGASFFSHWLTQNDFQRSLKIAEYSSRLFAKYGNDLPLIKKEYDEKFNKQ
jgi:hypothetical protein